MKPTKNNAKNINDLDKIFFHRIPLTIDKMLTTENDLVPVTATAITSSTATVNATTNDL